MLPADDATDLARLGISTTALDGAGRDARNPGGADAVQAAAVVIDWNLFKSVYESSARARCSRC